LLKGGVKQLKKADQFPTTRNYEYHSLKKNVPPFKYRSDGSGRDSYVLFEHAGLEKDIKPMNTYNLQDFLRKYGMSSSQSKYHDNNVRWMNKKQEEQMRRTFNIEKKFN